MRMISPAIVVAAAGCGLVAVAPASAKTCPSGQFLQVSKGKCISKTSAQKLGIVRHTAHVVAKPKSEKVKQVKDENAGQTTAAKSAPEPASRPQERAESGARETTVASVVPVEGGAQPLSYSAAPSEPLTVRRNIAPFGALQFGGFN